MSPTRSLDSVIRAASSVTAVERGELGVRGNDSDFVTVEARRRLHRVALDDVVDTRIVQPDCDVEGALTRGRHRVALEELVGHVPQPRGILAVGDARVDRDHDTAF